MGKMISPSGHGRRFHVSMLILALFTVVLASPMATTSDAYANDDLKEPLASREVNFLFRGGRHVFFLTPTEAVLVVTTPKQAAKDEFPRIGAKPGWLEARWSAAKADERQTRKEGEEKSTARVALASLKR